MHFYTKDGKPAHFQPTKKGAKNPTRPTTIRDAKALKLYPSVTEILKVVANPGLEQWKLRRVAEAAMANIAMAAEESSDYVNRIIDTAFDDTDKAASLGERIHENISCLLKELPVKHPDCLAESEAATHKLVELGVVPLDSEFVTINPYQGYGGTVDLRYEYTRHSFRGIGDFKSTKTYPGEPVVPRQGQCAQIAAYIAALNDGLIPDNWDGMNIYVSTTEPGRVDVISYDREKLMSEFSFFQHANAIWRHLNDYDPRAQ